MTSSPLSLEAARRLRGGRMPHVAACASPISTTVRLHLEAPEDTYPEVLITDPRRESGWRVALSPSQDGHWYADILLPSEPTLLRYHFVLRDGSTIRERRQLEGESEPLYGVWEERDFQLAAYDPNSTPPEWLQGGVVYQIFPDRFAKASPTSNVQRLKSRGDADMTLDSVYGQEALYLDWSDPPEIPPKGRDFYGGDLRGVINKLDYLRDLGISAIYFTPIFASPTNHRYDAIDYFRIDPRLGTEEDFKELLAEAEERDIRIMLDGVFNHCSGESVYFTEARKSKESPYYRWFDFTRWPDRWIGWLGSRAPLGTPGVKTMPEFVECPEVEEFFFGEGGVALHWLSYGIAGWRTDVTPWITDEFWRRFRKAVRGRYPDAYLVAEDWGNATHRFLGDTYDATMNYRFGYSVLGYAGGKLSPAELDDRLETLRRDTPPPSFHAQMNLLGSHDTARVLTRLGGSKERVMLAAAVQLAYPGVPMVYYGDEAGLDGAFAEDSRRPFPWGAEDETLLTFYRNAVNARNSSNALRMGDVSTIWIDDRGGYGFLRHSGEEITNDLSRFAFPVSRFTEAVVALFNNGSEAIEASVPLWEGAPDGDWPDLLGGGAARCADGVLSVTLPALGAGWFNKPDTP